MRFVSFVLLFLFTVAMLGCSGKPPVEQVNNTDGNATTDGAESNADSQPTDTNEPTEPTDGADPVVDPLAPGDGGEPAANMTPAFVAEVLPFLTTDHIAAAGIHVPSAMNSKLYKSIPDGALQTFAGRGNSPDAMSNKILAGDSGLVYAWALVGPVSDDKTVPPTMSFVVSCETAEQLNALLNISEAVEEGYFTEETLGDTKYYKEKVTPLHVVHANDHTLVMVLGEEPFKTTLAQLGETPDTPLVAHLQAADADGQIVAAGFIEPVRDQLAEAIAENVQGPMAMLAGIPKQVNSANLSINLDGETIVKGNIEAVDAETASQLNDMLEGLVTLGAGYLTSLKEEADESRNPELMKEGIALGEDALAAIKPTANGPNINLTMTRPASLERLPEIMKMAQAETEAMFRNAYPDAARTQLNIFKAASSIYRLDLGVYPAKLDDLIRRPDGLKNPEKWRGPYVEASEIPKDPWENDFYYANDGDSIEITSFGPDGEKGGGDDITIVIQ